MAKHKDRYSHTWLNDIKYYKRSTLQEVAKRFFEWKKEIINGWSVVLTVCDSGTSFLLLV